MAAGRPVRREAQEQVAVTFAHPRTVWTIEDLGTRSSQNQQTGLLKELLRKNKKGMEPGRPEE